MNLKFNKAGKRMVLHQGDVNDVCPLLGSDFDRIVMPLPTAALHYLPVALSCLKSPGRLHLYTMQSRASIQGAVASVEAICRRTGRQFRHCRTIIAGHTGPNRFRYCIEGWVS